MSAPALQPATPAATPKRGVGPELSWDVLYARAPLMSATMARFLDQMAVSCRPGTVRGYEIAVRHLAGHVTTMDPACVSVAGIGRPHIEAHKRWLAARPGRSLKDPRWRASTIQLRLGQLRLFFERIIDWGYDDAPARAPIFEGDLPKPDVPLPKFLDDPTAAKFMAALATDPDPKRRLMVELLARTGMRSGELSALESDAMVRIGDTHWLRIPVGKLHTDRYVPLHPVLVELINDWLARRPPPRSQRLVERQDGNPYDRRTIGRYVAAVARRAGIGHVHPHQLRHTLATQAVNRGMSLEAIAALLGHRSMRMTLTYARISDRTVADEYFRVTQAVEARYEHSEPLTPDLQGPNMRRLAADHRRLLGNGHCTRPVALDCNFETICERCGFFETGPQFVTILRNQRDDAVDHNNDTKAELFTQLLDGIDTE